jgi:hypothetical protein
LLAEHNKETVVVAAHLLVAHTAKYRSFAGIDLCLQVNKRGCFMRYAMIHFL